MALSFCFSAKYPSPRLTALVSRFYAQGTKNEVAASVSCMVVVDPNFEESFERRISNLLSTDLDVGLRFVRVAALSQTDEDKRRRAIHNAKTAYAAVTEWLSKRKTLLKEHPEIADKLNRLRTALQQFEKPDELQDTSPDCS